MKRKTDDIYAISESIEERKFRFRFEEAIVYEVRPAPGGAGQELIFRHHGAIHDLFLMMANEGDEGFLRGVKLFLKNAARMLRPARSHFISLLADQLHEMKQTSAPLRECEVGNVSRFARELLPGTKECTSSVHFGTEILLAWAEDANTGVADVGVPSQPTALIRGILMAPSFDHARAVLFWDKAAKSESFPCRIFSDPCPWDEGVIFSSWHVRAFGRLFTVAPPVAISRFAAHMREHAIKKMVLKPMGSQRRGQWAAQCVPADENDRERVFRCIVGAIDDSERRERVTEALQLTA